jgi:hypothetical protein
MKDPIRMKPIEDRDELRRANVQRHQFNTAKGPVRREVLRATERQVVDNAHLMRQVE